MAQELLVPRVLPEIFTAKVVVTVHQWRIAPGDTVERGTPLVELRYDMGMGLQTDCPPVTYLRVVARSAGVVESITSGETIEVGSILLTVRTRQRDGKEEPFRSACLPINPVGVF
jgi:pyruvate/2-oxoglutarate dehydrogenase complex dihydrolipoamide acyltransferase (E2) component